MDRENGGLNAMTYNFDPDAWYEIQRRLLDRRLEVGEIDEASHSREQTALELRREEMWRRLDGANDNRSVPGPFA